jgi:hypothetical protein
MANPTADQLRTLKSQGHAMAPAQPGGNPRYYIRNRQDLHNAILAVGRGSGNHNTIRKFIMKEAKRLGFTSMIPDNWSSDGSTKTVTASGSK